MSAPKSILSCIVDPQLWNARYNEERDKQVANGRCTVLQRGYGRGRLTWCQRKASIKNGPCEHHLNEAVENLDGRSHIVPIPSQTAGVADDYSGFNPRMLWFYVGMEKAAEDTHKVSEDSRD